MNEEQAAHIKISLKQQSAAIRQVQALARVSLRAEATILRDAMKLEHKSALRALTEELKGKIAASDNEISRGYEQQAAAKASASVLAMDIADVDARSESDAVVTKRLREAAKFKKTKKAMAA